MSEPRHDCIWDVIGIVPPVRISGPIHPRTQPEPVFTIALVRCRYCHIPASIRLEGTWDEDQIKGVRDASDTTAD
jgi:hypothetical protein